MLSEQLLVFLQELIEILVDLDPHLVLDLDVHVDRDRLLGSLHRHLRRAGEQRRERDPEPKSSEHEPGLLGKMRAAYPAASGASSASRLPRLRRRRGGRYSALLLLFLLEALEALLDLLRDPVGGDAPAQQVGQPGLEAQGVVQRPALLE